MDEDEETSPAEDSNEDTGNPSLTEEHQEAVSNAFVQSAMDRGIDVSTLAQQIGLSTDDINAFTQGDYLKVAQHLAHEHPELVRGLTDRIPLVGGLIGNFLGGNS